jgi:hypothetical protein
MCVASSPQRKGALARVMQLLKYYTRMNARSLDNTELTMSRETRDYLKYADKGHDDHTLVSPMHTQHDV